MEKQLLCEVGNRNLLVELAAQRVKDIPRWTNVYMLFVVVSDVHVLVHSLLYKHGKRLMTENHYRAIKFKTLLPNTQENQKEKTNP